MLAGSSAASVSSPAVPVDVQDEDGGVRVLTLNRPPANAFDAQLIADLGEAAKAAADAPAVRAVVIRGNDRFFSGGLDLKKMAAGEAAKVSDFGYGDGIGALWTMPKPTVAEIRGHAIAGGGILALACDFRIAAAGSQRIGLNETAIGLAFPVGAFEIARSGLPHRHFPRVILEAELYEPEQAKEYGFVHEIVPAESLSNRCLELARKLGAYPSGAYAYNKALAQGPNVERCKSETAEEKQRRLAVWSSEETINAFFARAQGLSKKG